MALSNKWMVNSIRWMPANSLMREGYRYISGEDSQSSLKEERNALFVVAGVGFVA